MTTKQQELQALDKIRKIVDGLGADSYIAAAFDGCFEMAAENIANDWACSMQQRAISAEKRLADTADACGRIKTENFDLQQKIADLNGRIENLDAQRRAAEEKAISAKLYKALWINADDQAEICSAEMASAAQDMADFADTPSDIAFQHAVKMYKARRAKLAEWQQIIADLEKIKPAGC